MKYKITIYKPILEEIIVDAPNKIEALNKIYKDNNIAIITDSPAFSSRVDEFDLTETNGIVVETIKYKNLHLIPGIHLIEEI